MTNERIWWDGRYLPKGERWGTVHGTSRVRYWVAIYGHHGRNPYMGNFDTKAAAKRAVEQWVREQVGEGE